MCRALLQDNDGHDCCLSCLGLEHLKQGLTQDACMNCRIMSWGIRTSSLAAVEGLLTSETLSKQCKGSSKCKRVEKVSTPASKIRKENALGKRVDALTSEFAHIKSLLINLQPREAPLNEAPPPGTENSMELPLSEEDAMSMAASQSQFCEGKEDFFI